MTCKTCHGRFGRYRVACDRCVCADPRRGRRTAPARHRLSNSSLQGDWRTSKVVGLNVYNDNNESIGSINDLLTDKSGNIKAVVLGVGGFLGVGAHLVAVPYDKVKFVNEPIAYTAAANSPEESRQRPGITAEHHRCRDRNHNGCGNRIGPGPEGQPVVSGPRRVQRHQGSAQGDA